MLAIVCKQWILDPYSWYIFAVIGKRLDRAKLRRRPSPDVLACSTITRIHPDNGDVFAGR